MVIYASFLYSICEWFCSVPRHERSIIQCEYSDVRSVAKSWTTTSWKCRTCCDERDGLRYIKISQYSPRIRRAVPNLRSRRKVVSRILVKTEISRILGPRCCFVRYFSALCQRYYYDICVSTQLQILRVFLRIYSILSANPIFLYMTTETQLLHHFWHYIN